jgi:fatty acid amide hydrolase 2
MNPLTASAMEMAAALRARTLSSRDLVDAHIARVVAVNRRINAMVQFRFDEARLEADAADLRLRSAEERANLPPFLGVPCTIKENFAFPGYPQVSGMVSRRKAIATREAPTITRLRAAGAIVLGFSNTPELCMWMETANRVYGRTRNPYDARRIAGGSSGGEGALVGAGASPFGLGADVGGSIRFPAFFNGVFGHKPTPGIVPNTGQYPLPTGDMNRNCVTGPIARRAEDLWPLLKILAGPDGIDPVCTAGALKGDPRRVKLDKLRIFAIRDDGTRKVAEDLSAAQARAADWLGSQSAEEVTWLQPRALRNAFDIWAALMQAAEPEPFAVQLGDGRRISTLRELVKWPLGLTPHTLPALVLALIETLPLPMRRYVQMGKALRAELIDALGDDGVLLYPPYTRVAPKHNRPLFTPFDFAYCGIFNVLGFPVTQVPLGLNAQGLPLGVQVVGAPGRDAQTIAVARALEQQFGGWVMPSS